MTRWSIAIIVFLTLATAGAAYGDVIFLGNSPVEMVMDGSGYALVFTIPLFSILMLLPWRQTPQMLLIRTFACTWLLCISWVALFTAGTWPANFRLAPIFLPLVLLFVLLIYWKKKSLVPGKKISLCLLYIGLVCVIIAWIVFSAEQRPVRDRRRPQIGNNERAAERYVG